MPLSDLAPLPEPFTHATALLARLDQAFLGGFARLGHEQLGALESLGRAFSSTPLGPSLREALAGLTRSEFLERHFLVLAAARSALQGAQHDALLAQACTALGRPRPALEALAAPAAQQPPPQLAVWLESTRHWLMELALAGFSNLGVDTLLPFQATLEAMQPEPRLARHAALLSGLLNELLSVFPTQGRPQVPLLRWADLWTRAMVLCASPPAAVPTRPVSGELRLLAADLRQHATFASLVAYGVLREKGRTTPRLVRTTLSSFKVDVIQGEELAVLFNGVGPKLLESLGASKLLTLNNMPLTPSGDLLWQDSSASPGGKYAPLEEAAAVLAQAPAERPCLEPADRHPALIEELVYLKGYKLSGKEGAHLVLEGATLPIAYERWPETGDLGVEDLQGSTGLVGLLRFDGGSWSIQPLALARPKGARVLGSGLGAARGSKGAVLSTLQERASKLLRQKAG